MCESLMSVWILSNARLLNLSTLWNFRPPSLGIGPVVRGRVALSFTLLNRPKKLF